VAIAWATATDIVVAQTQVAAATGALTDGPRLHITAAGAQQVTIVHVEAGIALAGQFTGGTIDVSEIGGFVVTWTTSAGTFAARISDHTHALVPPGAMQIGGTTDAPQAFVDYADHGGSPRVRIAAHDTDAFVVFPNVCGAAAH